MIPQPRVWDSSPQSGYDPRAKLVIVMCISSLAVFLQNIWLMTVVLSAAFLFSMFFKSKPLRALSKLRRMIWVFLAMVFIQSIFTQGGEPILTIRNVTLISSLGMTRGITIFLRVLIIIISASIMNTSNSRDIVQGLYQWKVPYELAFMVSVSLRFLPLLKEEIEDMITAIQLRGLDFEKVPTGKKIRIYSYLIMPMIASVIGKAQDLAIAVEMRGFRAFPYRTSFRMLRFAPKDYILMITAGVLTVLVFFSNHMGYL